MRQKDAEHHSLTMVHHVIDTDDMKHSLLTDTQTDKHLHSHPPNSSYSEPHGGALLDKHKCY